MKYQRLQKEHLENIIKQSFSYAEVIGKLGRVPTGGAYATIKNKIQKFNIDISHFTHSGWRKGKTFPPKRPIGYFYNKTNVTSSSYKKRLIKEGLLQDKCEICGITQWLEKPISLHLHHIDGDRTHNHIDNLQILCPNCHSQTDNYAGKSTKIDKPKKKIRGKIKKLNKCLICNQPAENKYCSIQCYKQSRQFTEFNTKTGSGDRT